MRLFETVQDSRGHTLHRVTGMSLSTTRNSARRGARPLHKDQSMFPAPEIKP